MSLRARDPRALPAPYKLRHGLLIAASVSVLALGFAPTEGQDALRSAFRSLHAERANRADHDGEAGGYYVGLIDGDAEGGRDELTLALLGKPPGWANFHEVGADRDLYGDFLQFELIPGIDVSVLGTRFRTNALGLRDRPYAAEKPEGVFRIALLGSSMDMGWGVGDTETYENRFEDWLNARAEADGLGRRFEVMNFAMAAYSPLHRLESLARKALATGPDLVIYSATRLDQRLLQIHLVGLIGDGVDLKYDFLRRAVAEAGTSRDDLARDSQGRLIDKDALKAKLAPALPGLEAATLETLAAECRSAGVPLAVAIIPRASESDGPSYRADDVDRLHALCDRIGLPTLDLSAAFDEQDPAAIEIAPWDDHPNALGHRLLSKVLARAALDDPVVSRMLFEPAAVPDRPNSSARPAQ